MSLFKYGHFHGLSSLYILHSRKFFVSWPALQSLMTVFVFLSCSSLVFILSANYLTAAIWRQLLIYDSAVHVLSNTTRTS